MAPKPRTTASFSDSDSSGIKVGLIACLVACTNLFGFFSVKYNQKQRIVYIQPNTRALLLGLLLAIFYILPLTMCPPPPLFTNDNNITLHNSNQFDYLNHLNGFSQSSATSLFDIKPGTGLATHLLEWSLNTSYKTSLAVAQLIPESTITSIDTTLSNIASNIQKNIQISQSQGESVLIKTLVFYTISPLQKLVSSFHSFAWPLNPAQTSSNLSNPSSTFYTSAAGGDFSQKSTKTLCNALYNTQNSISVLFHRVLNITVSLIIRISNASRLVQLDELECGNGVQFNAQSILNVENNNNNNNNNGQQAEHNIENQYKENLYCAWNHIRQRTHHLMFPEHPPWPIYRLGQPLVSFFYNAAFTLIPPEDQIMMRSTSFLQTSILRAVTVLEIPDAIDWYNTGLLYGLPISPQEHPVLTHISRYSTESSQETSHTAPQSSWKRGIHIEDLAKLTCTHAPSLQRLLRSSSGWGVFTEISPLRWENTQMSILLRRPASPLSPTQYKSLAWAALMFGNEQFVAQSNLASTVETGSPSFTRMYGDFWDYHHLSKEFYGLYLEEHGLNQSNNSKNGEKDPQYQTSLAIGTRVGRCHNLGSNTNLSRTFDDTKTPKVSHKDSSTSTSAHVATQDNNSHSSHSGKPFGQRLNDLKTQLAQLPYRNVEQNTKTGVMLPTNNQNPIQSAYLEFNNAMTSISSTTVDGLAGDSNLFHTFDTFVDIAGGKGHLLQAVLQENVKKIQKYQNKMKKSNILRTILTPIIGTGNNNQISVPSGMTKLTTAVLFDLPYTYDNQETMIEVKSTFSRLLTPSENDQNVDQNVDQKINNKCQDLEHLIVKREHTPKDFVPKYEMSQNDDSTNNNGNNPSYADATMPCTAFTVHQGSFFDTKTLPQSYEMNKNIILKKYLKLILNSEIFTIFDNFILKNAWNYNTDFYSQVTTKLQPLTQTFLTELYTPDNESNPSSTPIFTKPSQKTVHFHTLHETGYAMMQILHDWNQIDSTSILNNLRIAATVLPQEVEKSLPKDANEINNPTRLTPIDAEKYAILCHHGLREHFPRELSQEHQDGNNQNDQNKNKKLTQLYFSYQFIHLYCQQNFKIVETKNNPSQLSKSINSYSPVEFSLTHNKKVLVIDRLLPSTPQNIINDHGGPLGDMLMMNNFNNAQERSVEDFVDVFKKSGWALTKVHNSRMMYAVVEGVLLP